MAGITLVAFAYMYYVSYNDIEGFETLTESFLTVFVFFVGGPGGAVGLLDIIFGVVTVVGLLNVVIAIVSNAWDDATEPTNARLVFWSFRIHYFHDVDVDGLKKITKSVDQHDDNAKPSIATLWSMNKQLWSMNKHELYSGPLNDFDGMGPIQKLCGGALLALISILGLISLGLCWPMCVREYLFAESIDWDSDEEIAEDSENKELVTQIKGQSGKLDSMEAKSRLLSSKVSEIKAENKDLVTKVSDMKTENKRLSSKVDEQSTMMDEQSAKIDKMKAENKDLATEMKNLIQVQNNQILSLLEALSKKE
mmetsp:Transcript_44042/g.106195  ORF Transcript_44042/g.106195 Transcript_44042/m.106195 type:complete len:309 (-) Transcript_44042:422-1348(-)